MPINSFAPIPPGQVDCFGKGHDGYPERFEDDDTPDQLWDACGDASTKFTAEYWIEPSDWADRARDNDKYGGWAANYVDRFTNQSPTHECTCHSLSRLFESCRNKQRGVIYAEGPKRGYRYAESAEFDSVWVSPLSIYAEANPRQWGGASIRGVLSIATRRGFLPSTKQPRDYGFAHALHDTAGRSDTDNQASGPWTRVSSFPAGWEQTAALLQPQEVIFPESWEQAVCLVLHGLGVGVGRKGHAIPWMVARFNSSGDFAGMDYVDSYQVIRTDSAATVRSAWRGSYAIETVRPPADWEDPARG